MAQDINVDFLNKHLDDEEIVNLIVSYKIGERITENTSTFIEKRILTKVNGRYFVFKIVKLKCKYWDGKKKKYFYSQPVEVFCENENSEILDHIYRNSSGDVLWENFML